MTDTIWLRGEYEFASLFSYRLPDFSSAYAPSAPMPGPSAVKLALVATAIETLGRVQDGENLFDVVKDAPTGLEIPNSLAISRVLIKRLKQQSIAKAKSVQKGTCSNCRKQNKALYELDDGLVCKDCGSKIIPSFGNREYVHFGGSVAIYLKVASDYTDAVANAMRRLRRIGTSDSLLYCLRVNQQPPDLKRVARVTTDFNNLDLMKDLAGRPAFRLKDIRNNTSFSQVNPFSGLPAGNPLEEKFYVFPMRIFKQGKSWVWYRQEPFSF